VIDSNAPELKLLLALLSGRCRGSLRESDLGRMRAAAKSHIHTQYRVYTCVLHRTAARAPTDMQT
jgi:hypothetical protein